MLLIGNFWLLLLPCVVLCDDAWLRSLNYFNRINDMMSYDKSNFTTAPNAFVLVTIPKGTKLEHIREVDKEERRFSYHLDTFVLANETYEKPPSCFVKESYPRCSFFSKEKFPDVNQYRSLFREMLNSKTIKGIQEYQQSLQAAIRNLVNRVSLLIRQLKAEPEKYKTILHNSAGVYGLQNTSISEQVQKCVSFHTPSVSVGFDVDFVVQNRFARENGLPGKARREAIREVQDSFQHVTEYLCSKMIDIYWNGSKMNITNEITTMQDRLKWKEFDLCPKECGHKCIKSNFENKFYYCEQGAVGYPGLQPQSHVGRYYRNLFQ